jgi:hypothetical protein
LLFDQHGVVSSAGSEVKDIFVAACEILQVGQSTLAALHLPHCMAVVEASLAGFVSLIDRLPH